MSGILEYPTLRKTMPVYLSDIDKEYICECIENIIQIADRAFCPPLERRSVCKNCSYYEFCYIMED